VIIEDGKAVGFEAAGGAEKSGIMGRPLSYPLASPMYISSGGWVLTKRGRASPVIGSSSWWNHPGN